MVIAVPVRQQLEFDAQLPGDQRAILHAERRTPGRKERLRSYDKC